MTASPSTPTPAHPSAFGKRAIAAMSGGVDSSAVAKLLVDTGFEVLGITLKLYGTEDVEPAQSTNQELGANSESPASVCCSLDDVEDARSVCRGLGIPHRTLNFSDSFESQVIDAFCNSYLQGETPNPCINCNRYIKFCALHQRRRELGYDYVATGHYARCGWDAARGRYVLKTGLDTAKDQSYVLYSLTQEELAHTLFPLGELTKPQVRSIAEAAGFVNAHKAESQDICFIPDGDYRSFIQRRTGRTLAPGDIVDKSGKVLGRHAGLDHYTIGQRKGIGIAAPAPLYVCEKDLIGNRLIVGTIDQAICTEVAVEDVNWVALPDVPEPLRVTAKTFYRQKPASAVLTQTGPTSAVLTFDPPIRACAPGQAAVFYLDDLVVGGGTITGCR